MNVEAVVLMFFGVLCMSGHNITQRWVLRGKPILSKRDVLVSQHIISLPVLFISFFIWGGGSTHFFAQPKVFWLAVVATTSFNVFIQYANVKSKELADTSLVTPIQALTPGLVVMAALVLGEVPSWQGVIGILLISVGVYVHSREDAKTWHDWLLPFSMLLFPPNCARLPPSLQAIVRPKVLALRWAFLSACLGTGGLIFDSLVARHGSVEVGFSVQAIMLASLYTISLRTSRDENTNCFLGRRQKKCNPWTARLLLGGFYGLHVVFVMTAFRLAPVAYIGTLKRFSIVIVALLAWWLLGEIKVKHRLWPILVITAGSLCLAFDGTIPKFIDLIDKHFLP